MKATGLFCIILGFMLTSCSISDIWFLGFKQKIAALALTTSGDRINFIYDNGNYTLYSQALDGGPPKKETEIPKEDEIAKSSDNLKIGIKGDAFCNVLTARKRRGDYSASRYVSLEAVPGGYYIIVGDTLTLLEDGFRWWFKGLQVVERCNTTGGPLYRLNEFAFKNFAVSPDGSRLAFDEGWLFDLRTNEFTDYLAINKNSQGSEWDWNAMSSPAWAPDGRSIAYVVRPTAEEQSVLELRIVSLNEKTSRKVDIPQEWLVAGELAWKGELIVCEFAPRATLSPAYLGTVKPDGTGFRVYSNVDYADKYVLSDDDRYIYFTDFSRVQQDIYRLEVATGDVKQVVDSSTLPINQNERVHKI